VYPDSRTLGPDMRRIVSNIGPLIYQRGGFIYTDLTWAVSSKRPKIRQFVLTTSDYCKLYVTAVVFHVRVASDHVPVPCGGESSLHVPLAFGILSRVPYLTFPKLFLSHLCHSCSEPSGLEQRLVASISQLVHGVPLPLGSSSLSMWNLPSLEGSHNELLLYMGDVGITGNIGEENHPVQSTYARSFTEVDLVALFDILSLEVIISVINALLLEQKILLVSSKWSASFIAHLCEAFRVLIYPFDWQHVYIPLIPTCETTDEILPFWLSSATCPEHVHPFRFLEVPAPLFGGLKIRSRPVTPISEYFAEKFPDLNLVDIDNDIMFPAKTRIDQVETPLPNFPRKLTQLITVRLAPIVDNLRNKARIPRYLNWDRIVPREVFSNISIHERRNSSSSSGGVTDSYGRRRSLIRTSFSSAQSADTNLLVATATSSGNWLGGFSSLFRTHTRTSRATVASTSSSRTSSVDPTDDIPAEFPDDSDFELTATTLIQSAFIEAFVRIFFAYKDFFIYEQDSALNSVSHFEGGDRHFQIREFIKCVDRHGIFGTDSMYFIKTFITTQSWDIFIRTTAFTSTAHLFDTACAYYCSANKLEYSKFKQVNLSVIVPPNHVYAELPSAVEKELQTLRPCPIGIKPKEFFFDELKALLLRMRRNVDTVIVAGNRGYETQPREEHDESPITVIEHALSSVLPALFGSDPNMEAVKYANISTRVGTGEFIQLLVQVFSQISNDKKKSHLLHAVLSGELRQRGIGVMMESLSSTVDQDVATVPVTPPGATTGIVSALWSYKRSPLFRAFSVNAEDAPPEWGKKILGGIPKSAANIAVPAVSSLLMRNWSSVKSGDLGFLVCASELAGIDFSCRNCGACSNINWVIRDGNLFDQSGPVSTRCVQCNHVIHVNLIPNSNRGGVELEGLGSVLESVLDQPVNFAIHLNLQFFMGLNVEVYTSDDTGGRRELRGVINFVEILVDYLNACHAGSDDSPSIPSEAELVDVVKQEDTVRDELTPRSRARLRIREYRRKQREKPAPTSPPVAVIRINVDRSVSPPPGKPGGSATFRRRVSGGISQRSSTPMIASPSVVSPPVPPSERRPPESAPRRVHRRSSEFSTKP
jgi:hypothetical protein